MLNINNIVVQYGHFRALHGVSLTIHEGETVALLGGNGAGKTTTINTISGLTDLVSGTIEFEGKDISKMAPPERVALGIVQVPEGRKLFPYMSVYENLMVGSTLKSTHDRRKENLEFIYQLFPKLYERRTQLAYSLSGGEQQMCAIGRGLMQCPKLLMMDEPSLGLAPIVVDTIFQSLDEICKMGITVLLVEQNVASSLEVADRAYLIEVGQNVMNGTGSELLHDETVKKAYLGI